MTECPTMLTIQQTADKAKLSYNVVWKWSKENKFVIKHTGNTGKKILINWESFVKFLNGQEQDEEEIKVDIT